MKYGVTIDMASAEYTTPIPTSIESVNLMTMMILFYFRFLFSLQLQDNKPFLIINKDLVTMTSR